MTSLGLSDICRQLSSKMKSLLQRLKSRDRFWCENGVLMKGRGLAPPCRVRVTDMVSWALYPEMVFDTVVLRLSDGTELHWLDKSGDLQQILAEIAGAKRVEAVWRQ